MPAFIACLTAPTPLCLVVTSLFTYRSWSKRHLPQHEQQQQHCHHQRQQRWPQKPAAASGAAASPSGDDFQLPSELSADSPEESGSPQYSVSVFPRLREKDPYRLLGVDGDAGFEEVQDARNYLYEVW